MAPYNEVIRFNARNIVLIEQAVRDYLSAFSWARLPVNDSGEGGDIVNAHQRRRELKALLDKLEQQRASEGQDLRLNVRDIALIEHAIRDQISGYLQFEVMPKVGFATERGSDTEIQVHELQNVLVALDDQRQCPGQLPRIESALQ